ncbi:polysaccharide biosynthesis/export family protein [Pseudomonas wadenswilerensis]|jgi:protein involved in polysaccharide export with SLBB domain|uniref:Polysaccharide biosynthesis protein n=1 Tax=Pseudomonas wadenswilerensis TaxID=1785161 RepID=A0A380SY62_9PSED|nr:MULTISPECIES: polysaccharide biosynthesis/export family protein [Pseudomonas]MCE5980730.1 polysaccharide biosynthesis/export family protein [Pseudomonas sp. LF19]UVM24336.1 polysaccharide biosynthesis/export family protein [Pseudomonas wadenswilerensis]SPO66671.1 Periplasmic protein involved in polysaccharide export [Pseudomonas sp. JV241A]SUQ62932.1 Polysaccharide biosynthesis protein [Pseudomonas wadenswilerensis]
MKYTTFALCLLTLAGCANQDTRQMPVQIMTAAPANAQDAELPRSEQVLRPQDVLDVIFHISTSGSASYRIQSGDTVGLAFPAASSLNGNQLVLPDGTIELPRANTSVNIAGQTPDEARRTIQQAYRNKRLFQPGRDNVTVQVISPLTNEQNLKSALNHPATGMSREITVGSDGQASFPEIGSVPLQGMTVTQLQTYLNKRYADLPGRMTVDVMLKSTAVNEIYVLGEVGQPGAYPIRRPVSVLEALTLARGPNVKARLDSVVIMRRNGNQVQAVPYNVDKALDASAAQVAYLQPDDMLYVPKTKLASAGDLARQLADVVLFQGVGFSFGYRVDNKDSDNN